MSNDNQQYCLYVTELNECIIQQVDSDKFWNAGYDKVKVESLIKRLNEAHRPNIQSDGKGLSVCWNNHNRSESCSYELEIEDTTEQPVTPEINDYKQRWEWCAEKYELLVDKYNGLEQELTTLKEKLDRSIALREENNKLKEENKRLTEFMVTVTQSALSIRR